MSEEDQSCPICLEHIFLDPSSENDGANGNTKYNIGATVPCGHLFHYDCFDSWRASQMHREEVKCPTCNVYTKDFVRLYLDIGSLGGAHCNLAGDDDISLSSIEDEDIGDDDGNSDNGDNAEEEMKTNASNSLKSDNVVDLTAEPLPRRTPSAKESQCPSGPCCPSLDQEAEDKISKLSRLAKKFKRQCLQKTAKYKEQYAEKQKVAERVRRVESELKVAKAQNETLDQDRRRNELQANDRLLNLLRVQRNYDSLTKQYKDLAVEKHNVENQLHSCRSRYEKELEEVRAKTMSEVRQILDDHPKVVEENRILKQRLQKLNQRLPISGSRKSKSKDITKALRQMDQQIRNRPNGLSSSSSASSMAMTTQLGVPIDTKTLRRKPAPTMRLGDDGTVGRRIEKKNDPAGKPKKTEVKLIRGQYSSLASRIVKESSSALASQKPKRQRQSAAVRDILSSPASKSIESKKRSSLTSLGISQNKRIKQFGGFRKDFFERKR